MKLKGKTVNNQCVEIEAKSDDKIIDIKKKFETAKSEFAADRLKLIFNGKVLDDDKTVGDYPRLQDNCVIIVIINKKIAAAVEVPDNKSEATVSSTQANAASSEAMNLSQEMDNIPRHELHELVDEVSALGIAPEDAMDIMRANMNSPHIRDEILRMADIEEEDISSNPLNALRNHQSFPIMQHMVRENPEHIRDISATIIEYINASNPEVGQIVSNNQDVFLNMLLESANSDQHANPPNIDNNNTEENMLPSITLTDQEMESVQRLEALGFPRERVIIAYLSCDKDEELAANFLAENTDM